MSAAAPASRTFANYWRYFAELAGRKLYLLILVTLVASYVEGIGIALFFPLFSPAGSFGNDFISRLIGGLFRLLHLSMTPMGALPAIVILFVIKGALNFAATGLQYSLSAELTWRLRLRIVEALRAADYRYGFGTNSGFLTNLLVNEVPRATAGFLSLTRVAPPMVNITVFAAIMLTLDWHLTILCAVMGVLAVVLLRAPTRLGKRYSAMSTAESGILAGLLIQTVQSFKYLKATGVFSRLVPRIDSSARQLARAERQSGLVLGLTFAVAQPLMVIFLSSILYYRIATHPGNLAPLFVLMLYLFRIMAETFILQTNWQVFVGLTGSVDIVRDAIPEIVSHREQFGATPWTPLRESLVCRDVTYAYAPEKPPVLRNVNLEIVPRSTVAFVGESGAGKSTLIDVLTGTLKPTAGKVLLDGRDLSSLNLEELRRRVGYVSQDCAVFDDTVANNISLWSCAPGDDACAARVHEAAERAQCGDFIAAMPGGFDAHIGERGTKLSGGQRQRLAIARELFKQPEILVLDEATSALDSESEMALQRSIDTLKGKVTILIIAHRLSTLRGADRVFVLEHGRLVEQGGYQELLARPDSRFRRMCELQNLTADP